MKIIAILSALILTVACTPNHSYKGQLNVKKTFSYINEKKKMRSIDIGSYQASLNIFDHKHYAIAIGSSKDESKIIDIKLDNKQVLDKEGEFTIYSSQTNGQPFNINISQKENRQYGQEQWATESCSETLPREYCEVRYENICRQRTETVCHQENGRRICRDEIRQVCHMEPRRYCQTRYETRFGYRDYLYVNSIVTKAIKWTLVSPADQSQLAEFISNDTQTGIIRKYTGACRI